MRRKRRTRKERYKPDAEGESDEAAKIGGGKISRAYGGE
jgi:hypothetical protein